MLASIIANLQNVTQAETRLPTIKIDRGGGGATWPNYDIVDIMTALQTFPEISGENAVSRAVRRTRWIGEALPRIKDARERREGAAFLAGATVADAAAEERNQEALAAAEARHRLIDQLKIDQLVEIIDEVRGSAVVVAPLPTSKIHARGQVAPASSTSLAITLGVGVAIGILLARSSIGRGRRSRTRSRAAMAF